MPRFTGATMYRKYLYFATFFILHAMLVKGQTSIDADSVSAVETEPKIETDTLLRIVNLNPYFTLHVDSALTYQLAINKEEKNYYWYLKNSPIGLKISKDNGLLTFKPDRSFFLSGKLKYDVNYPVSIGVQNLSDPKDKIDTSFTIVFYNTEVILPKVKPTIANTLIIEEGEQLSFKVQCEAGNFPIEEILFNSNIPIHNYTLVKKCDDEFNWIAPYDFAKETDSAKARVLYLNFIGSTKYKIRDTATIKIIVKDALNYPLAKQEYDMIVSNIKSYTLRLKYTFLQLDKKLKKTKTVRTSFDLTSATTALTGTIFTTTGGESMQTAGKILPSVGVALVPVKEASVPNKVVEQNQASLIRSSIKRLEYMLFDYTLVGEKDPAIITKISKLKEEMKQSQMQLIDIPIDITNNMTEQELNNYFNSPKVNKKYRLTQK